MGKPVRARERERTSQLDKRGLEVFDNGANGMSDIEHVAIEGMELLGKAT